MLFMLELFGIFMHGKGQTSIDVLSDCSMANWIKYQSSSRSNYCTACNSQTIYGGPSYFTELIKSYQLLSHNKITIQAKLWSSIQLTDNRFFIIADNQLVLETIFDENLGNQGCGQIYQASLKITIDHKCSSLTIYFYSTASINWWALKEFEVLIHEEDQNFYEGTCYITLSYLYQEIHQKTISSISGWQLNGSPYSSLYSENDLNLLGSLTPSQTNILQKSFIITMDSYIQIQFKLISYAALGFVVQVLIDNVQVLVDSSSGYVACRAANYCYLNQPFITPLIQQNQRTIVVKIQISSGQYVLPVYAYTFGFRDFKLAQYTEISDKSCTDGTQYIYTGSQIDQFLIQEGCNNLINGICVNCKDGWTLDQDTCYPQCGDSIITNNEECDDGNKLEFDGCHQCKFSCPLNCEHCQFGQCKKCKNQYSLIKNKCEIILTDFNLSIKVISILQYFYDFYQNNKITIQQYSNIQQFYINDLEYHQQLVDDQLLNYLQNSNQVVQIYLCEQQFNNQCIQCSNSHDFKMINQFCSDDLIKDLQQLIKNQCQQECLICLDSLCLTCIEGWIQIDFQCQSICGDGLIALNSQEQCDDGNQLQDDGCYNCQVQCSSNCEYCDYNPIPSCKICQQYYSLDNSNLCIPICGDGHIIQNYEECDDGNDVQFDGCYQCQIECKKNCKKCEHGICLDQCDYGYYLIDDQCQNMCGDGIVTKEEECDDGNDVEFDSCFKCQKSCLDKCVDCNFGRCFSCSSNYYPVNNYCQLCGNGLIDEQEQCDDANIVSNDGCSSDCFIEEDFYCLNFMFQSVCDEIPRLLLNYIGLSFDTQYVDLTFSKKVKLDRQLTAEEPFTFEIFLEENSENQLQYVLTLDPIIELSNSEFLFARYRLSIQFLNYPNQISILFIKINTDIQDENGYIMDIEAPSQVALQIIEKKQIAIAQSCQTAGNVFIKLLGCSSLIMLAFGEVTTFIQILDVLQYYSFLKYINIDYPRNLQIFFQATDQISADPILEQLKFVDFFQFSIGYEYVSSFGQFDFYSINSELISNIQPLLLQIICLIFFEIFLIQYQKYYYKIFFKNSFFYWLEQKNSNCLQQITSKFHKINKELFKAEKITSVKGVFQLFEANFWDLSFKFLLFLETPKKYSNRVVISYIFCIFFVYLTLFFIVNLLKKQDKLFKNMKGNDMKYLASLFVKKIIVLAILIQLQFEIVLQNILLVLINSTYILMIITFQLISDRSGLITIIITELPLIAFTALNFAYFPLIVEVQNVDLKTIFGYVQISLLLSGLIGIFIKNMITIVRKLIRNFGKSIQHESKQQQNQKQKQFENFCQNVHAWNFKAQRITIKI